MSKETKLTSKVIQITTTSNKSCIETLDELITRALCKDGSIWEKHDCNDDWFCILEAGYDKKEEIKSCSDCIIGKVIIKKCVLHE